MDTLTRGSVVAIESTVFLHDGWKLARSRDAAEWHDAVVPGTVAAALGHDLAKPGDYDADDWWYRKNWCQAPLSKVVPGTTYFLRFDGLATLAGVWLNGERILESRNMFRAHRVEVTRLLKDENVLEIRFASLESALAEKRPRPRWKTALVESQNLRWFRTTLLGRIPGWMPPVTPVGPWAPIALECVDNIDVTAIDLQARAEGSTGRLGLRASVASAPGHRVDAARVRVGDTLYPLAIEHTEATTVHGDISIPGVPLWWPHTHGTPALVACQLELMVNGAWRGIDCGKVGFKQVDLDTDEGRVRMKVNGAKVFCRGAVWTTADFLKLHASPAVLRQALEAARDAGLNMLRIGGTMVYESDDFYRLCDELGILVWQDFMFASMDYPVADPEFAAEIDAEVRHQLGRLQRHACIAAYCGGSEVAQQAAMMGLPADQWSNEFFRESLPRRVNELHAGIPCFPSTPWGGALPIHVGTGIAHYYGVGAYRRPLNDVKMARVKFTSECLGFSNVPDAETMSRVLEGGGTPAPHHPRWKERVPRDNGAGYDFEDVRDHYLELLFDEDPGRLRSHNLERYYAISRVVSGEVMNRVFAEWRAPHSGCGGALVWFYRDLWPGAGWGITDSSGHAKAPYWYLKRAWAPRSIHLTDEGLDGLGIHAWNEGDVALVATVELEMYHGGRTRTGSAIAQVKVPARGSVSLSGDALLGYFSDSTNAYRFGPPKQDVITARLRDAASGELIAEDFYFPIGMDFPLQRGAAVEAAAQWREDGTVLMTLRSDTFLQAVSIASPGFTPSDNYFHVAPGQEKRVLFKPADAGAKAFKSHLEALNIAETIDVRAECSRGEAR